MTLRIGAGAGQAYDRVGPAQDLAERGDLDFLVFECLAERTLAHGHVERMRDSAKGYNPMLETRLRSVLPACRARDTRIVSNMGSANPPAAGEAAARVARELGFEGLRIAVVEGDDVTALVDDGTVLPELGTTVATFGRTVVGANAYLGAEAIAEALEKGADIVLTGRVADPSLFLAPIAHHYGWSVTDWDRIACGTAVGHLLECTTQVTGGYFADPGFKEVPGLDDLGYPIAEVDEDGSAVITKLAETGGLVSALTVKEQLLYEVHDPRAYLTPDVAADFSRVRVEDLGGDRVRVSNAGGRSRPGTLKALVAFGGGFRAEAEFSYAGPGAQERAELAREIVRRRMTGKFGCIEPMRFDIIGVNSIHATGVTRTTDSEDVRLRFAMRTFDRGWAELLFSEVDGLHMAGPAGGGGYRNLLTPTVLTQPTFVDRDLVRTRVSMVVA
ncbi:MAG: hypothetical protein K0S81_2593 [Rhodospirillales bacterium]|nr:hypothetical protein [Rhodospirillales bacterium]